MANMEWPFFSVVVSVLFIQRCFDTMMHIYIAHIVTQRFQPPNKIAATAVAAASAAMVAATQCRGSFFLLLLSIFSCKEFRARASF